MSWPLVSVRLGLLLVLAPGLLRLLGWHPNPGGERVVGLASIAVGFLLCVAGALSRRRPER